MGQKKDTKNLNNFITPGLFPAHIVIWCPDWFFLKKTRFIFSKMGARRRKRFSFKRLHSKSREISENLADFEGICGYKTQHGLYAD